MSITLDNEPDQERRNFKKKKTIHTVIEQKKKEY